MNCLNLMIAFAAMLLISAHVLSRTRRSSCECGGFVAFKDRTKITISKEIDHCGIVRVVLIVILLWGAASVSALARGAVLNPAHLGTFCPPGSELADAKHTEVLSTREQAQIEKTVQGFMALDAEYRRAGSPRGSSEFWEKGYTLRFDDAKEVPDDGLQYIAAKFTNTCTQADIAIAVVLLDVAQLWPAELDSKFRNRFLSAQGYWDAFQRTPIKPPSKAESSILNQPLIFVTMPLSKHMDGRWLVEQRRVPVLIKFSKRDRQHQIDLTNLFSCSKPKTHPQYSADRCAQMEKDKAILQQLSRPAWSVVPKDYHADIVPRR